MSWGDLPVLPLCRVYEYLPQKDCLAASSACRHWRYCLMFFRIKRDFLRLKVDSESAEKNSFLTKFYRRNLRRLECVLASSIEEYSKFGDNVLESFCNSKYLNSVTLVPTPEYLMFESTRNTSLLQTLMMYLLKFCDLPTLKCLNIHGCGELTSIAPALLKRIQNKSGFETLGMAGFRPQLKLHYCPQLFDGFVNLQTLSLEYSYFVEDLLLSFKYMLPSLKKLCLNVCCRPPKGFRDLHSAWQQWSDTHPTMTVTINCICLTGQVLHELSHRLIRPTLPLEKLRVMFCKSLDNDIVRSLVNYRNTFRELLWVDAMSTDMLKYNSKIVEARREQYLRPQTTNPLIMMCWRCINLEYITVHGYWQSPHDLLGMARLRGDSLKGLAVSALLPPMGPGVPICDAFCQRFRPLNEPPHLTEAYIQKMKCSLNFPWKPLTGVDLHPSLISDPDENPRLVQEYVLNTIRHDVS